MNSIQTLLQYQTCEFKRDLQAATLNDPLTAAFLSGVDKNVEGFCAQTNPTDEDVLTFFTRFLTFIYQHPFDQKTQPIWESYRRTLVNRVPEGLSRWEPNTCRLLTDITSMLKIPMSPQEARETLEEINRSESLKHKLEDIQLHLSYLFSNVCGNESTFAFLIRGIQHFVQLKIPVNLILHFLHETQCALAITESIQNLNDLTFASKKVEDEELSNESTESDELDESDQLDESDDANAGAYDEMSGQLEELLQFDKSTEDANYASLYLHFALAQKEKEPDDSISTEKHILDTVESYFKIFPPILRNMAEQGVLDEPAAGENIFAEEDPPKTEEEYYKLYETNLFHLFIRVIQQEIDIPRLLRAEAGKVSEIIEMLKAAYPHEVESSSEPLPLLMLRAVVYEHTLLELRNHTQTLVWPKSLRQLVKGWMTAATVPSPAKSPIEALIRHSPLYNSQPAASGSHCGAATPTLKLQ